MYGGLGHSGQVVGKQELILLLPDCPSPNTSANRFCSFPVEAALFLLLTYFVRFANPAEHFRIEIFFARDAELIEVISRREIFDARKSRTVDPVLQPETSDQTLFSDTGNSREAYPRLEADPRFVDVDFHRSTFAHQFQKSTVELLVSRTFLPEELFHGERPARVPNIPDDKRLPAPRTGPKRPFSFFFHTA